MKEDDLVGEEGLLPHVSADVKYQRLLYYRRYRLGRQYMTHGAKLPLERVCSMFQTKAACINKNPFNRNGREPKMPLTGAVLTFLSFLRMEAPSLDLTEGDSQRAIRGLVGPAVSEALLM